MDTKAEIVVKDNRTGIPQKVSDKIFQPFFTTKPTRQVTGFGLSLACTIVKAQGGELSVESCGKVTTAENEGTGFTLFLPTGVSK